MSDKPIMGVVAPDAVPHEHMERRQAELALEVRTLKRLLADIAALEKRLARIREVVEHMPLADSRELRAILDEEVTA